MSVTVPGFHEAVDVVADAAGAVFILTREPGMILVLDGQGGLVRVLRPETMSNRPHGIAISPDGGSLAVADAVGHVVLVLDAVSGRVDRVVGRPGVPSRSYDPASPAVTWCGDIIEASGPFCQPTKVAFRPGGGAWVSDGYANARIHRFDHDWAFQESVGEPGSELGEFRLPHSVLCLSGGNVLVADRENDRLQVFSESGDVRHEVDAVSRPAAVAEISPDIYLVAELEWAVGDLSYRSGIRHQGVPAALALLDLSSGRVSRTTFVGDRLSAPHGLAVDAHGSLWITELARESGISGMATVKRAPLDVVLSSMPSMPTTELAGTAKPRQDKEK